MKAAKRKADTDRERTERGNAFLTSHERLAAIYDALAAKRGERDIADLSAEAWEFFDTMDESELRQYALEEEALQHPEEDEERQTKGPEMDIFHTGVQRKLNE